MALTGKIVKKYHVAVIFAVAVILRLISLNQSLWLDEAIGAIAARDYSYSEIVTEFILADNHTPGYYLLLKFWAGIFGYSEIGLRSLSVVFGVLTVFLVYKINKIAALLLATSQIHVYYSQEARMYAMAAFFTTLSILFFTKAVKENKNIYWAVFSLSVLGLMASDYMPIFLLPVFPVYLLFKNRKLLAKLALSFLPLALFGLFWFPVLKTQIENYAVVPDSFLFGGATLKALGLLWTKFAFGRLSFEPKSVYYLLVALVSFPVVISLWFAWRSKNMLLFWLGLAVPVGVGFVASFFFPAFGYFRFIFVLPAFYILIAVSNKKLLVNSVLLFNFLGLLIYYTDANQQREQWRQAVDFVEEEPDSGAIALFEFSAPFAPYQWYSKDIIDAAGATDSISAGSKTTGKTSGLISNKNKIYYFEYLRDVSDPSRLVEQEIEKSGFVETSKTSEFVGVGAITTYEKIN